MVLGRDSDLLLRGHADGLLKSFAKEYIESRFKGLLEGALAKSFSPTSRLEIAVGIEDFTDNTTKKET